MGMRLVARRAVRQQENIFFSTVLVPLQPTFHFSGASRRKSGVALTVAPSIPALILSSVMVISPGPGAQRQASYQEIRFLQHALRRRTRHSAESRARADAHSRSTGCNTCATTSPAGEYPAV